MKVLMGTKQFKMILDEELVERLRNAADSTGRDSAQHLAEEILTIYLPVYTAVSTATRRAIEYQTKGLATKREQNANGVTLADFEINDKEAVNVKNKT